MKRTISFGWPLIWLVFSLLFDLGGQWFLQSNPSLIPHTLPLWMLLPGYILWAALTMMALKSVSLQAGRGRPYAILMFVLWSILFISLTVQGHTFWTALLALPKGLYALYTQLVTATPGFFRLNAALLVVLSLVKWVRAPRLTL